MGKTKGKIVKDPATGYLVVRNTDTRETYPFDQPFQTELGIVEKTPVTYDLISTGGKSIAVSVQPVYKGIIQDIDVNKGVGTILETESNTVYNFQQNYLAESGFAKDDTVKYALVSSNGVLWATCLEKIIK